MSIQIRTELSLLLFDTLGGLRVFLIFINGNPVDFDFKDLVISILIPFLEDVIRNFVLDTKRLEGFSVRQNFSLVVKPFYMIINFSYKAKRLLFIVRENTAFLPPHQ